MGTGPGYFAISRKIFDHPLFRGRPQWHRAWEWIIAQAAWCTKTVRLSGGSIELQRGQLAITVRALAEEWGWPKSTVDHFLRRLEDEAMIVRARSRTRSGTRFGTRNSHPATVITICNYDKFQNASQSYPPRVGQDLGQDLGQVSQQAFDFPREPAPNHSNHYNHKKEEGDGFVGVERGDRKRGRDTKPTHGARSADGNLIWFDYETQEWSTYAQDYREVRSVELLPESRIGGRGNWFWYWGEAKRPQRRRKSQWTKTIAPEKPTHAAPQSSPTTSSSGSVRAMASLRTT